MKEKIEYYLSFNQISKLASISGTITPLATLLKGQGMPLDDNCEPLQGTLRSVLVQGGINYIWEEGSQGFKESRTKEEKKERTFQVAPSGKRSIELE